MIKDELKDIYLNLNPIELKRNIYYKWTKLYRVYKDKKRIKYVDPYYKLIPRTVRTYMIP